MNRNLLRVSTGAADPADFNTKGPRHSGAPKALYGWSQRGGGLPVRTCEHATERGLNALGFDHAKIDLSQPVHELVASLTPEVKAVVIGVTATDAGYADHLDNLRVLSLDLADRGVQVTVLIKTGRIPSGDPRARESWRRLVGLWRNPKFRDPARGLNNALVSVGGPSDVTHCLLVHLPDWTDGSNRLVRKDDEEIIACSQSELFVDQLGLATTAICLIAENGFNLRKFNLEVSGPVVEFDFRGTCPRGDATRARDLVLTQLRAKFPTRVSSGWVQVTPQRLASRESSLGESAIREYVIGRVKDAPAQLSTAIELLNESGLVDIRQVQVKPMATSTSVLQQVRIAACMSFMTPEERCFVHHRMRERLVENDVHVYAAGGRKLPPEERPFGPRPAG